jgi:hypothetical protein
VKKIMKVVYCCYGGTHSSVVTASIHLGMLPSDKIPSSFEIERLPYYDKVEPNEIGTPFFMGKDELGCEVYIIGMINQKQVVKKAIKSFLENSGIDTEDLLMINTLGNVNIVTKFGGFISRRLGLVKVGRQLTIWGIRQKYFDFVRLAQEVKKDLGSKLNLDFKDVFGNNSDSSKQKKASLYRKR